MYRGILLLVVLAGCKGQSRKAATHADTLTQRQRDSAIGASQLPGAKGVQRALDAADSAAARNEAIDSAGGAIQ